MDELRVIRYAVVCRSDRKDDGRKGDYELATSRLFRRIREADDYQEGISRSREPMVVQAEVVVRLPASTPPPVVDAPRKKKARRSR